MLTINEREGITKDKINFGNYLISLLKEYKENDKIADYDFASKLLTEIYKNMKGKYICSNNGLVVQFDVLSETVCIDSKTLQKLVINYMLKKRKQNLLTSETDTKTNYNILFSTFILHEIIHLLQYNIVNGADSIFKDIYGLQINKMKSAKYSLFDNLIYHKNHFKYVNEKSANCYSLQILLELLENTDLISDESFNDFINIYFTNLLGCYRYDDEEVIGECFDTYKLLGQKNKYQNLVINSDIPLFVKMSNGFTLNKDNFEFFYDVTYSLKPCKAKQIIFKL